MSFRGTDMSMRDIEFGLQGTGSWVLDLGQR